MADQRGRRGRSQLDRAKAADRQITDERPLPPDRREIPERVPSRIGPKREGEKLGFLDVLLLGAPDGKTELLDGKVIRQIIARDSSQARAIFKTIAREMTEIHGIGWRKRLIEGKSMYEVDRYKLFVDQDRVELEVAVTPALWRAFAAGPS